MSPIIFGNDPFRHFLIGRVPQICRVAKYCRYYKVKRSSKGILNFLCMVFCLFLFVQPALQDCDDIIDTELLTSGPAYEKPHQHDMAPSGQGNYQGLKPSISALMLLLPPNLFKHVSPGPSPIFSASQQASGLRC